MDNRIYKELATILYRAMCDASKAHNYAFGSDGYKENIQAALSYAQTAFASEQCAKAIYFSNLEKLENDSISELFPLFEAFVSELQDDFSTNHSLQWVSIHFEKLKSTFESSPCANPSLLT